MDQEPLVFKVNHNFSNFDQHTYYILGRPLDLRFLLSSSEDSIPYFYFIFLACSVISVGISFARILTYGKNPVISNIMSFKFLKVLLMLILKFLVQSYFLSMAVKSLMYKFVSKDLSTSESSYCKD